MGTMAMLFRAINVAISLVVAYLVYTFTWHEFYDYLPSYDKLKALNEASTASAMLRENSLGLRELYYRAHEKSLLYGFISLFTSLFLLSYIKAGNWIMYYFSGMKRETKKEFMIDQ